MANQKYYVDKKNGFVTKDTPVEIEKFVIVNLPSNNGWLYVRSKNKEYPDYKVALAIAFNQIKIDDVFSTN